MLFSLRKRARKFVSGLSIFFFSLSWKTLFAKFMYSFSSMTKTFFLRCVFSLS